MNRLKKFLSLEVGIEIKACLYFALILFFYFCYQIARGSLYAGILLMVEMVLTTYAMCYIEAYVLNNFDEAERFDKKTIICSVFCSAAYAAVSYFLNWYDKNIAVTAGFFGYMFFSYLCVFLCFKIKRDIDTAELNRELEEFKQRKD